MGLALVMGGEGSLLCVLAVAGWKGKVIQAVATVSGMSLSSR